MEQANEILKKNLASLAGKNTGIIEAVLNHKVESITTMKARSGDMILVQDGIPINSLDDPVKEAESIYENVENKGIDTLNIIFGFALGYLTQVALDNSKGKVLVYEPNLDILRASLENNDLSELLSNDRLFIFHELKILKPLFISFFMKDDKLNITMLNYYGIMFTDEIKEIQEEIKHLHRDVIVNTQTVMSRSKNWTLAALHNIFDLLKNPNVVGLKEKLKDVPAVIVSAGPSLELVIEELRKNQNKIFIVCVGQALKALDKAGIKPHLVVVIENLNVTQQFEDVSYINDLTVVLQPMSHRDLYQLPTKRILIYFPVNDTVSQWFKRISGKSVEGYPNRGTVSASALFVAAGASCNPLMLAGQDLAFTDGKRYAAGTAYDKLKYELDENGNIKFTTDPDAYEKIGKTFEMTREEFAKRDERIRGEVIQTTGWDGEKLYTTVSYSLFMGNFSDIQTYDLKNTGQKVINTSEKGAFIKGLEHLPFTEALKECNLDHGIDLNKVIDELFDDHNVGQPEILNLYNNIKRSITQFNNCIKLVKEAQEIADKILREMDKPKLSYEYINKLILKLGKLDKTMISILGENQVINPFITQELYEYNKAYGRSEPINNPEEEINNLRENIASSIKLYKAILEGSQEVNKILPIVLEDNKNLVQTPV